jgi:hypothetical protein
VSVEGLAHHHPGLERLPIANAHVVDDREPGDYIEHGRLVVGHVLAPSTDHHPQLAFVVDLVGSDPGDPDAVAWTDDAALLFVEPNLPGWARGIRFFEMLGIVVADRQELRRARHRRGKLHA